MGSGVGVGTGVGDGVGMGVATGVDTGVDVAVCIAVDDMTSGAEVHDTSVSMISNMHRLLSPFFIPAAFLPQGLYLNT